ncbi:MAG: carbohydrate porin [Burkholderiales bacterium]|nr:carbohydrate porin [Burkholderiales bacterium]
MRARMKGRLAATIATLAFAVSPAAPAAEPNVSELVTELKRLADRVEKLERLNAALARQLATSAPADKALEARVKELEAYKASVEAGLASESVSEKEPELTARLKAVENTALDMQKQAKVVDAIEGFEIGASLVSVAQRASSVDERGTLLNYRADLIVTTPTIETGSVESKLFAHLRAGQGAGVADRFTSFVGPNATAFQLGAVVPPDNSAVLLAEFWYQADIPLPLGGFKPNSREKLTVNFGKMDPFAFFDQNRAANDETRQFLASMFVHNALLDNPIAANVGADGFGFSPGFRVAYANEHARPERYALSAAVFGAGESANFTQPFKSPFVIGQAEVEKRFFAGLPGTYRFQLWRNGQAPTFVAAETRAHSGFGLGFDQKVDDALTVFGRAGAAWGTNLPFDRTASLGLEIGGDYWDRGADAIGFALGANRTSGDFRTSSATVDADGDGIPDYGFAAQGWEYAAELYYRFHLHQRFELSPDVQYIRNPAGNRDARPVTIVGLRALLNY